MAKKPRSDSKLKAGLTLDQQDQLRDWMLGGIQYRKVQRMVKADFGVTTSLAALSDFYESRCVPYLLERRTRSAQLAKALEQAVKKDGANYSAATMSLLKQRSFEMMSNPNADPKEIFRFITLFLKSEDQALSKRKVALLEQKAAFADEVKRKAGQSADGGLSAEDMADIERRLKFK